MKLFLSRKCSLMLILLCCFSLSIFCALFSVDSPPINDTNVTEVSEVSEEVPEQAPGETTEEFLEAIEKNSLMSSAPTNKNNEPKNIEASREEVRSDEHEIL